MSAHDVGCLCSLCQAFRKNTSHCAIWYPPLPPTQTEHGVLYIFGSFDRALHLAVIPWLDALLKNEHMQCTQFQTLLTSSNKIHNSVKVVAL